MNKVTNFKFWLAGFCLAVVFIVLTFVLFFSTLGNEIKASIVTFFITVPGTLIVQYYFRKAGSNEAESDISPKADSPVTGDPTGTSGAVQGWGEPCKTCNTTSSDKSDFTISDAPVPAFSPKVTDIINSIFAELKADGIKQTAAAVASRIVSWLGVHESELTNPEKADLLDYGIGIAQQAYVDVTGIAPAPQSYKEVADYNKWWREHQKACKSPKAEARAVLMTLRDLLKRSGL